MNPTKEPTPSSEARHAAAMLRDAPTPPYDLDAGLARHRALVVQGALPAALAARGPLEKAVAWIVSKISASMLATLTVLSVLTAYVARDPRLGMVRAPNLGELEVVAAEGERPETSSPLHDPSAVPARAAERARGPVVTELQHEPSAEEAMPVARDRAEPAAPVAASHTPERAELPRREVRAQRSVSERPPASARSLSEPSTLPVADAPIPPAAQGAAPTEEELRPAPSARAPARAATSAEDPVEREMRELADAQRLLRAFPHRALDIARASDTRFKPGYLRQERRLLIVRALLALKRRDEAEQQAKTFRQADPDPAFHARIEAILGRVD